MNQCSLIKHPTYICIYIYLFINFLKYWTYHLYAPTSQLVYLITLEQFWSHIPLSSNISLSIAATKQRIKPFSTAFCPVITFCAMYWVFQEIKYYTPVQEKQFIDKCNKKCCFTQFPSGGLASNFKIPVAVESCFFDRQNPQ